MALWRLRYLVFVAVLHCSSDYWRAYGTVQARVEYLIPDCDNVCSTAVVNRRIRIPKNARFQ